jgi:hypothetical protein
MPLTEMQCKCILNKYMHWGPAQPVVGGDASSEAQNHRAGLATPFRNRLPRMGYQTGDLIWLSVADMTPPPPPGVHETQEGSGDLHGLLCETGQPNNNPHTRTHTHTTQFTMHPTSKQPRGASSGWDDAAGHHGANARDDSVGDNVCCKAHAGHNSSVQQE